MGRPPLALNGARFGRLLVINRAENKSARQSSVWHCQCDCGSAIEVIGSLLTGGRKTECKDCSDARTSERMADKNFKHGLRRTAEYKAWDGMRYRCASPKAARYPRYGGRGITVCDRWQSSFEAFYEDMGPRPSAEHSLEREDTNGNYEPGNCSWATRTEQANNRNTNRKVIYGGAEMTLRQAINAAGNLADKGTVHFRIVRLGWSVEKAVATPSRTWVSASPRRQTAP